MALGAENQISSENECRYGGSCGRVEAIAGERASRRGASWRDRLVSGAKARLRLALEASGRAPASQAGSRVPCIPRSVFRLDPHGRSSIREQE